MSEAGVMTPGQPTDRDAPPRRNAAAPGLEGQARQILSQANGMSAPGEELARLENALAASQQRVAQLESALTESIRDRTLAESDGARAQRSLTEATARLVAIERSHAWRAVERIRSLPGVRTLSTTAWLMKQRLDGPRLELPFGGFATAGYPATPEAFLRAKPRVVSICHPEWRGIRAASYALGEAVLEIPAVADGTQAKAIGRFLAEAGTQVVILQGFPPGTQRLAVSLRRRHAHLRLLHVYHGSSAWHTISPDEGQLFGDMLNLLAAEVLDGVGLVKVGMAHALCRCGYRAFPLFNKVRTVQAPSRTLTPHDGDLHIGVFVPNLWYKNLNTQVLAALALPKTKIHVIEAPPASYLERFRSRIVVEGLRGHDDFVRRLGEMDANLYVSLSECYPMTVIESLERGVPCLTSDTSPIFDDEPYLREKLVVTRHDDPWAIAQALETALRDRVEIVARSPAHLQRLNAKADRLWVAFIGG